MPSLVRRALAFAAPVALGATALVLMQRARSEPKERPPSEQGRAVRVIEVQSHEAVPRAVGYGVARSQREWKLVAEVSGRVIELDPQLQTGRIIRKGTKLIKIDPEDYELVATQQEATVGSLKTLDGEIRIRFAEQRRTRDELADLTVVASKDQQPRCAGDPRCDRGVHRQQRSRRAPGRSADPHRGRGLAQRRAPHRQRPAGADGWQWACLSRSSAVCGSWRRSTTR